MKRTDTYLALVNDQGHFFSPRSGKCQPDLKPLAHLYADEAKINKVLEGYNSQQTPLKIVRVQLGYQVMP